MGRSAWWPHQPRPPLRGSRSRGRSPAPYAESARPPTASSRTSSTCSRARSRAGASPQAALASVVRACPGPTSARLDGALARLRMGVDPVHVWGGLVDDDVLAAPGRTLARAETSGSSVADAVERLADELERSSLASVEDRARAVGVKAAVPPGLCLLPAFLLIGIVPTVAGLLSSITP
ncbi:type II secretion system F family protein [Nocardioides sp. B-3]|uniref:type II secretion system F family protein n=1 Tax=Nocardioides sp. B-3 TaxID=2895565 RepID=UPI00215342C4|nr:type II secretion system F family protein [Nocardioides sp. B-3]UUZ60855.1 type II secretion system F family protein [Nocardioides sp. B-3]